MSWAGELELDSRNVVVGVFRRQYAKAGGRDTLDLACDRRTRNK